MKRKISYITTILLIIAAGAIYADDWGDIAAQHPQYAAGEKSFVSDEAAKMRAAGLDAKPLYSKVREGLAKGVQADALRRAVTRERESYERAAQLTAKLNGVSVASKVNLCQAIVISMRRGTSENDIRSAIARSGGAPATLVRMIDMLGDLARSGIHGDGAVNAAHENAGRNSGTTSLGDRGEGRADANRSLQHRELRQDLPNNRPVQRPTYPPTGGQGQALLDRH